MICETNYDCKRSKQMRMANSERVDLCSIFQKIGIGTSVTDVLQKHHVNGKQMFDFLRDLNKSVKSELSLIENNSNDIYLLLELENFCYKFVYTLGEIGYQLFKWYKSNILLIDNDSNDESPNMKNTIQNHVEIHHQWYDWIESEYHNSVSQLKLEILLTTIRTIDHLSIKHERIATHVEQQVQEFLRKHIKAMGFTCANEAVHKVASAANAIAVACAKGAANEAARKVDSAANAIAVACAKGAANEAARKVDSAANAIAATRSNGFAGLLTGVAITAVTAVALPYTAAVTTLVGSASCVFTHYYMLR